MALNNSVTCARSIHNHLTIDVEEWFQVYNLWGAIPRETWDSQPRRLGFQMPRLLDALDAAGCRATFFVLGWVARKNPAVILEIARHGHEVGCHGWDHALALGQTPEKFSEETLKAKDVIEQALGEGILGYRASNFSITIANLWAFDILAQAGFAYDSSVYPIRGRRYGIGGFPRMPVMMELPSGASLAEFPMPTMNVFGALIPVAGGGFFRFFPYAVTRRAIDALNRKGWDATVYLHPWEIDPEQPRIRSGGKIKGWMHYLNLDRTMPRLNRLIKDFKFEPLKKSLQLGRDALPSFSLK